jgi:hypothetical protein
MDKNERVSTHIPAVPAKLPKVGDSVLFVLRPLGSGVRHHPKVRPATVTEDWSGSEKHPTQRAIGPDGGTVVDKDGKPFLPIGIVNLKIALDGFDRKDHRDGHVEYEGNVQYDPEKRPRTWHWAGD